MTMNEDDRKFIAEGREILAMEWLGSYEEEQTKMFLGLILTKYEELVSGHVGVTDNKCDNRPKSIPEDQVDALSIIDKTLDNLETIRAGWGASDVVGLLQLVRDRIVRGYVALQEPSGCHHNITPEEFARAMAKVYEPDLNWDNPADFDLLDRTTLIENTGKVLERLKWDGFVIERIDDLALDEFEPAPSRDREGPAESVTGERRLLIGELRTAPIVGTAWRSLLDRAADALAAPVAVDKGKLTEIVRGTIDRRPYADETRRAIRGLEHAVAGEIEWRRSEWLGGGER